MHNRQRLKNDERHGLEMSRKQLMDTQYTKKTPDGVRKTLIVAEIVKEGEFYEKEGCFIGEEEWLEKSRMQGATGATQVMPAATVRDGTCHSTSRTLESSICGGLGEINSS